MAHSPRSIGGPPERRRGALLRGIWADVWPTILLVGTAIALLVRACA